MNYLEKSFALESQKMADRFAASMRYYRILYDRAQSDYARACHLHGYTEAARQAHAWSGQARYYMNIE